MAPGPPGDNSPARRPEAKVDELTPEEIDALREYIEWRRGERGRMANTPLHHDTALYAVEREAQQDRYANPPDEDPVDL